MIKCSQLIFKHLILKIIISSPFKMMDKFGTRNEII